MYNSGMYLPKVFKFIGTISIGTLHRWVKAYEDYGTEALVPKRRYSKENEYNTKLTKEMQDIFLKYLLHPNKFSVGKAVVLTKHILEKRGIENIPCTLTFRRFAEHYQKMNYSKWVLMREGEKAFHDKVEQYIVRDISKIDAGDVLIADGHDLNFLVINPFTGKPARAVLVGFLDWKSEALVGYEIMMSENTQCIASALRNAIINLGMIPKVVYQDNGRAFKAKYFQHTDFDEAGFNGVYANLGIKSVFAQSHNARAKVIERFFKEFQEEFEKMMVTYIGTSIENKPAWMKQGEKLHKNLHSKLTGNYVPTIEETIIYLNCWLDFYNSKPCPNDRTKTIKQCLDSVQRQDIDINKLDYLMMKSEVRTIIRSGITFLGLLFRNDMLMDYRDRVFIRYSLFDLTKIFVYSLKGEFLCTAYQAAKVHPMAAHLGTVTDMDQFRQQIKKQKERYNRVKKEFLKYHPDADEEVLGLPNKSQVPKIEEFKPMPKPKREKKLSLREKQMQRALFESDYEKYEWLKENGCTNFEDRIWMTEYMKSAEFKNLYGDNL